MGATIRDVAKLAGVSHTTVSWVIHDRPDISDATKKKVQEAIKELNYYPNHQARSLVYGKTNTIAVVLNFFSSQFELEILKGIEKSIALKNSGYSITLFSAMEEVDKVLKDILFSKRADALILLSLRPSPEVCQLYGKQKFPMVVVDEKAENAVEIYLNNFKGGYIAAEHIIKSGKKNIGIVLGSENDLCQGERKKGFLQALKDYNIPFQKGNMFFIDNFYFEEGQTIFKEIVKKKMLIDALFCAAGDIVATGVILEARNQGILIPDNLAIVGYDDIFSSPLLTPPLTTIHQPLEEIGSVAYEAVLKKLKTNETSISQIRFEPHLVIRESV